MGEIGGASLAGSGEGAGDVEGTRVRPGHYQEGHTLKQNCEMKSNWGQCFQSGMHVVALLGDRIFIHCGAGSIFGIWRLIPFPANSWRTPSPFQE